MRRMIAWTIASTIFLSAGVHAAHDCAQAKKDLLLAKERITASADDEATVILNQSIDECPTYDAYETLAEHLAVSDSGRDNVNAVDAFVAANARAPTATDRAQTLFQYAALLNRKGDPQNAYPLIQQALALDPKRSAIKNLAAEIDVQIRNPKTEEITRALRYSMFKPLKSAGRSGSQASFGGGGAQVNLPINFEPIVLPSMRRLGRMYRNSPTRSPTPGWREGKSCLSDIRISAETRTTTSHCPARAPKRSAIASLHSSRNSRA